MKLDAINLGLIFVGLILILVAAFVYLPFPTSIFLYLNPKNKERILVR